MARAGEHQIRKEYEKQLKAKDKKFNQARAAWKREVIELKKDHRKQCGKLRQLHRKALKNMAKYLQQNNLSRSSEAFAFGNQRNQNEAYAELNRRLTDLENIVQGHTNELALQNILNDNTEDSENELVKDEFLEKNLSARTRPVYYWG